MAGNHSLISSISALVAQATWSEICRKHPNEFFGKDPSEELHITNPKYFLEDDGSRRIPENIGESFKYFLGSQDSNGTLQRGFWYARNFQNTGPLSAKESFGIVFGDPGRGNYDNPLGNFDGFEDLTTGKMLFLAHSYNGEPIRHIELQSQNLPIATPFERFVTTEFSDVGIQLMDALVNNFHKISGTPGMRIEDRLTFGCLLDDIKKEYECGRIEPMQWHYT